MNIDDGYKPNRYARFKTPKQPSQLGLRAPNIKGTGSANIEKAEDANADQHQAGVHKKSHRQPIFRKLEGVVDIYV